MQPRSFLTLVAVCRDEHRYIEEWIEYHQMIGVDHFFIYDNQSEPPMSDFLVRYVRRGLVTVVDWPGQFDCYYQCRAYQDFLERFGTTTRWACDLDLDEFIYPKHEPLAEILAEFDAYAGLSINWQIFGPNDHVEMPSGSAIENYTTRASWDHSSNRIGKTIYRPDRVRLAKLHIPTPLPGWQVLNETGASATENAADISVERIQVNHYYTKSEQDWREGKMLLDSWRPRRKTIERFHQWREACTVSDTGLRDFVRAQREEKGMR